MPKRRGNPLMVRGGPSLNPRGRPRSGTALAEKIREAVDPDELVSIAARIARESESDRDRLAALTFLAERGYAKPAERHEVAAVYAETDDDDDLSWMTTEQLVAYEAAESARLAILAQRPAGLLGPAGAGPAGVPAE